VNGKLRPLFFPFIGLCGSGGISGPKTTPSPNLFGKIWRTCFSLRFKEFLERFSIIHIGKRAFKVQALN